jgi:hypothetical protein
VPRVMPNEASKALESLRHNRTEFRYSDLETLHRFIEEQQPNAADFALNPANNYSDEKSNAQTSDDQGYAKQLMADTAELKDVQRRIGALVEGAAPQRHNDLVFLEHIDVDRDVLNLLTMNGLHNDAAITQTFPGFIKFQTGPVLERGVNGTSVEVVLRVVLDRLHAYQRGSFPCAENQAALEHVQDAIDSLDLRTMRRRRQGVEGINTRHESR